MPITVDPLCFVFIYNPWERGDAQMLYVPIHMLLDEIGTLKTNSLLMVNVAFKFSCIKQTKI